MNSEDKEKLEVLYLKAKGKVNCNDFSEREKSVVKNLHEKYIGSCNIRRGCSGTATIKGYIMALKIISNNNINMENNLFELKNVNIKLHTFDIEVPSSIGKQAIALNQNIAIKLLKKHPGHIINFAKYPENWRDIVNGYAEVKEEPKQDVDYEKRVATLEPLRQYLKYDVDLKGMSNEVFNDLILMLQLERQKDVAAKKEEVIESKIEIGKPKVSAKKTVKKVSKKTK